MRTNFGKDLAKQKVQVQTKLAAEKTLATLTTNLGTTTLYVCSPTPRKQASGLSTTAKKLLSQETLEEATAELLHSYQETLNNLAQKILIRYVRKHKFHGQDISRDESTSE